MSKLVDVHVSTQRYVVVRDDDADHPWLVVDLEDEVPTERTLRRKMAWAQFPLSEQTPPKLEYELEPKVVERLDKKSNAQIVAEAFNEENNDG